MKKINWTRPLSPHLTIYTTEINSLVSILNRIFSIILMAIIFSITLLPKLVIVITQTCLGTLLNLNILFLLRNFFFLLLLYALIFHIIVSTTHTASENKKVTNICVFCLIFLAISFWI